MMKNASKLSWPGFSLLELLVAITIVSILCCVAYPRYTSYLVKVRRSNAVVALLNLANSLEQYYDENHSYQDATLTNLKINNNNAFYQLKIIAQTDTSYRITAIPKGAQATADNKCGALLLDQLGNKTISSTGDVTPCWR